MKDAEHLDRGKFESYLMKKTAGIVNTDREPLIEYVVLCDKLDEGSLRGAILDVFDPKPFVESSRL